jgi:LPXTG-motif cell wall-anchored protein
MRRTSDEGGTSPPIPQHGRTHGMYNLPHTGIGSILLAVIGLAMTAVGAVARLLGRRR